MLKSASSLRGAWGLLRRQPLAASFSAHAAYAAWPADEPQGPDADPEHRAFNFSPGPGMLSTSVMRRAQKEFCNYRGTGMGIMEMTNLDADSGKHPGEARVPVQAMMLETEAKLRQVLEIPDNYRVLFMHGGAVAQFAAVPLNLLGDNKVGCDICDVGYWSKCAMDEARKFCANIHNPFHSPCGKGFIPAVEEWDVRPGTAYVHITMNETAQGVEFVKDPDWTHEAPLIADATSTLLSRPIDIKNYGMIYASGGKNLPSGMAVAILREDLLEREPHPHCPQVLQYNKNGGGQPVSSVFESMPNTPPVFSVYVLGLVLDDITKQGGLSNVEQRVASRSQSLYDIIDASDGFYSNTVDPSCRSRMSVVFKINGGDRELERRFSKEASEAGLHYLFGHPCKGGIRVSLYVGLPDEAVERLARFMLNFRASYS